MKGDPAVIERTLEGYSGNWWLHKQGIDHKRTIRRWMRCYRHDAQAVGAAVTSIALVVWAYEITSDNYGVDSIGVRIILIIGGVCMFAAPYLFGLIMTIPLIRDKRRYNTTAEHAYYWRANKALRVCAPDNLSADEFSLIIEAAQRADRTAFESFCIARLAESIIEWIEDGKLPTLPEEDEFLEALRTIVRENAERPII